MTDKELEKCLLTPETIKDIIYKRDKGEWDCDLDMLVYALKAQLAKAIPIIRKAEREPLLKFIEWLRDEELISQDDWTLHCEGKYRALKEER